MREGVRWYLVTCFKESSRFGASCLKTEVEPASETQCFSVLMYLLHDGQKAKEEVCVCMLHTIVKTLQCSKTYLLQNMKLFALKTFLGLMSTIRIIPFWY
jgi:hypothetical protein